MTIPAFLLSAIGCERSICSDANCREAVKQNPETGNWFITMGHPGFNSPANNRSGYATREAARAAFNRYRKPRLTRDQKAALAAYERCKSLGMTADHGL